MVIILDSFIYPKESRIDKSIQEKVDASDEERGASVEKKG